MYTGQQYRLSNVVNTMKRQYSNDVLISWAMRNVTAAQNTFIKDISLTLWMNSKEGDTYSIQEWKVYDKQTVHRKYIWPDRGIIEHWSQEMYNITTAWLYAGTNDRLWNTWWVKKYLYEYPSSCRLHILLTSWISNFMHSKMWDEITYPFPNLNGATVEVWEWKFTTYVIIYPCWD